MNFLFVEVCGGWDYFVECRGQVPLGWEGREIASWIYSAIGVSMV